MLSILKNVIFYSRFIYSIETKFSHNLHYDAHMIRRRNIVSCFGIVRIPIEHPGLPKGYKNPALGMLLSLCEVSVV